MSENMLFDYFVNNFQVYLIIFIRILGLFTTAPFFSGGAMPFRFRLGLTFFLALVASPVVVASGYPAPQDALDFLVRLLSNFVLGIGTGFFLYVVFSAFQVSAQVFSIPMGMGMNEVVDPMSEIQVPALGNILGIMALFLLIRVDGHFYMIQVIVDSFRYTPDLTLKGTDLLYHGLINGIVVMFDVSIKISLPVIAVTLMLDMAMGLISRVAPQFNVMIMGFNIKLLAGFFLIWLILPGVIDLGTSIINGMINSARELIASMQA